jgi:hypothetical protein
MKKPSVLASINEMPVNKACGRNGRELLVLFLAHFRSGIRNPRPPTPRFLPGFGLTLPMIPD